MITADFSGSLSICLVSMEVATHTQRGMGDPWSQRRVVAVIRTAWLQWSLVILAAGHDRGHYPASIVPRESMNYLAVFATNTCGCSGSEKQKRVSLLPLLLLLVVALLFLLLWKLLMLLLLLVMLLQQQPMLLQIAL